MDSEEIERQGCEALLQGVDGILIPGGFGLRGTEGKIQAAGYAREKKIPFLGICLGMQMAIVEFARNVGGLLDAASTELNPDTLHPVIDLMPEQNGVENIGGDAAAWRLPLRAEGRDQSICPLRGERDL